MVTYMQTLSRDVEVPVMEEMLDMLLLRFWLS